MKAAKAGRSKPKTEPRQTKTDQEQPKTQQKTEVESPPQRR